MSLQHEIEQVFEQDPAGLDHARGLQIFSEFKFFLNRGEIRAAEKLAGEWKVNHWVKKGILLGFRLGVLEDLSINQQFHYFDKSTYPLKKLSLGHGVRLVPGGSAVRDGAFVAPGVVCMPPMYINVGAHIEEGTLVDSHVLVGSCAQIGKRVHLGAGAQIGGVLEPIGALPVIIEDDVFVGGITAIFDGTLVRQGAVIAAGLVLTRSTPVYDVVNRQVLRADGDRPLVIPERAVVVPGARPLDDSWAREHQISVATAVIVKYRDERTDAATALEEHLR